MARPFAREDVVERYEDWYATPFGALAGRIEREMLRGLLAPLTAGDALLEVGCGTAHFGAALAEQGFRVVGVDPEPAMLAAARRRVPVACADGLRLPFADAAFDGVVLVSVLEFVADARALLVEARRVARRSVVVLALTSRSWLALRRRVSGRLGHPIFARATFRSRARLFALAREAGAEPERVQSALFLPPALAGRLPRLELALSRSRRALPFGGIVGFALTATGAD